ncbi:metallopeptidase family protein [Candidatus Poribacteria bacterium]|nr:metallopeptidase family protein [Candidatus Poribacteria bacterium]
MKLARKQFEEIVAEALDELPDEIAEAMTNVFVVVEEWPSREILEDMEISNRYELLALYQGIPLTDRNTSYTALPDKITIFQGPLEALGGSQRELKKHIKKSVVHEIAHHFGVDDERIRELGY